MTQIIKNLDNVSPSTVQMNINGNQPIKINVNETMRERRDLWESANIDKNTDKPEWLDDEWDDLIYDFTLNNFLLFYLKKTTQVIIN